eukprot:4935913-Prymnesium_polylepis.1
MRTVGAEERGGRTLPRLSGTGGPGGSDCLIVLRVRPPPCGSTGTMDVASAVAANPPPTGPPTW